LIVEEIPKAKLKYFHAFKIFYKIITKNKLFYDFGKSILMMAVLSQY